ncbi:MAG: HAD family phosphatase [Synergistaceae bacterium]|nr:HAD family phosphatase [Synergistaceae bacterium]
MTRIKAVLFDMDGVLIDAKDWHYEALNKALGLFGLTISRYDHLHTFDGLPTRDKLKMLSEQYFLPSQLHSFINKVKQRYTLEITNAMCRPMFQHEYALSRLKHEGFKIAVCSNSVRATIELMMSLSGLSGYIDLILSNEDVTRAKPDPEIYTAAMEKLGMTPGECLVIEDNPKGIAAGRASGAFVLPVAGVYDVNYWNIRDAITKFEEGGHD